ncbi:MAG TPA: autotransporter-associated beta strand repeat-containing protein [Tepidisphaeraceae bacterium]|jgi:autotransporter-associated beta strand protein|nr:autotransporter-associated beta strand repeat-containing protein [Tepidisphaeraceae bacterium]
MLDHHHRSAIVRRATAAAIVVLGLGSQASADTFTWTGAAGDGVWSTGASQANWAGGVYTPGNGGAHQFNLVDPGYDAAISTIAIKNGHNPNASNLNLNGNIAGPLNIVIDGTSGGRLDFNAVTNGAETLSMSSGSHTISAINGGAIELQANDEHTWRISGSGVLAVEAPIQGSGVRRAITKRGGGTLRLLADNTFSGQLVAADGTIELASLRNIGLASAAGTGARFGQIQVSRTTSASHLNGALVYTGGTTTTDQRIILGRDVRETPGESDRARLRNDNATSTLTLTGGIVANEGGQPTHNMDLEIGGSGNINVDANDPNAAFYAGVNVGGIYGGINLVKVGDGAVRINTNSIWRGSTTVTAGTLLVNANHPIPNPTGYTVETGGTLGGTGAIAAPITIAAGANLRPGDGGGTLDVASVLLDGVFKVDLLSSFTFGQLHSTGSVALGETASLVIASAGSLLVGDAFTIIDTPNLLTGTFAGLADGATFTSGLNTY